MSNMSYCRFQNTSKDLSDCRDALQEMSEGDGEPLGREELYAAGRLVQTAIEILQILGEAGPMDIDGEDALESLAKDADKILHKLNDGIK